MNGDLISREALLKELREWGRSLDSLSENVLMAAIDCVCERIEEYPAVDAAPVVHGRWIPISEQIVRNGHVLFADGVECSVCREGHSDRKYCEECGTKMDLEE